LFVSGILSSNTNIIHLVKLDKTTLLNANSSSDFSLIQETITTSSLSSFSNATNVTQNIDYIPFQAFADPGLAVGAFTGL